MRIVLETRKNVEENAQRYFEAAKKARKKATGAAKAIAERRARVVEKVETKPVVQKAKRKRDWYERFRWCRSSDGVLLIGGRDAATNEIVVKKHTDPGDVVLHTDMAGSPFVIVKAEGEKVSQQTLEEAAQLCASFSRAWRNGFSSLEVFYVKPEQVTKEAQAGEHLPRGAFMIRGKTTYLKPLLQVALGMDEQGRVMAGPPTAVAVHCKEHVEIFQGKAKTSDVAKAIRVNIGGELDELVAALPSGCALPKK